MGLRIAEIAVIGIVLISFAIGFYAYPLLPEKIASHWNAQGMVNGYLDKFWGVFLLPLILMAMSILFAVFIRVKTSRLSYWDKKTSRKLLGINSAVNLLEEKNETFMKHFDIFIIIFGMFLLYIHGLTLLINLGMQLNIIEFMAPFIGLLFFYIGILLAHTKPNWFIGIRTPWTLSNEEVWNKTHKLGGKLFKISGILAILGTFFPSIAIWLIITPIIASALVSMVYSYIAFQRINGSKSKGRK